MIGLIAWIAIAPGAFAAEKGPDRPNEDAMFGGAEATSAILPPAQLDPATRSKDVPAASSGPAANTGRGDDAHELTAQPTRDAFETGEATDNGLQMGGLYYQRAVVSGRSGSGMANAPFSLPMQFDAFMDARPTDRLRGFVDGRMFFDAAGAGSSQQFSSTSAAPASLNGTTGTSTAAPPTVGNNPQVYLDQAWLKFDIDRAVYVTAGKQHVKWGTSRFWNPTDLLISQRRDPLLPYDLRLGNTMLKFHMPWESKKANFYVIALFDNAVPASTLGQIGGAFRAESVIGPAELGIDVIARTARAPVYGADLSAPLGPLDVYLEAACVSEAANPHYNLTTTPTSGADLSSLFAATPLTGPFLQISGGANYQFGWRDNRLATVGFEYFYNQLGYTDAKVYPILIFQGAYQPFYTGKNYAALYLTAEGPDAEKHTAYTFSTLGNLSDMSFISRLDFSWRVLTYLTFEAYGDVHFGNEGGEFNFSLHTPQLIYGGVPLAEVNIPTTIYDFGAALRLSF